MHLVIQDGGATYGVSTLVTIALLIGSAYGFLMLLAGILREFRKQDLAPWRGTSNDDRYPRRKDVDAHGERVDP